MADNKYLGLADEVFGTDGNQQPAQPGAQAGMYAAGVEPVRGESVEIARELNLPVGTVERNFDELSKVAKRRRIDYGKLATDAPLTNGWLADPVNASVAADDIDNLVGIEQAWDYLKKGASALGSGLPKFNEGIYGLGQAVTDTARTYVTGPLSKPIDTGLFDLQVLPEDPLAPVSGFFSDLRQGQKGLADSMMPKGEGSVEQGVYSGLQSLGQNLLTLPAAIMSGNPSVALAPMIGGVGGSEYGRARDKGLDYSTAAIYATSQAAVEFATEKLPMGMLIKDLEKNTGFMSMLGRQLAAELPGEQIATLLQDLNEWAALNPDKPFSSYLAERPNAALQTAVATAIGTGGMVTVAKGIDAAAGRFDARAAKAAKAVEARKAFEQLNNLVNQAKVKQTSPSTMKAFADHVAQGGSLYVDARQLANALQQSGIDINQVAADIPSIGEQLQAKVAAGQHIKIPTSEFLTKVAGSNYAQVMLDHLKTDPNEWSQAEADEVLKGNTDAAKAEVERIIRVKRDIDAHEASAEVVRKGLEEQLNTANRFSKDVNRTNAQLLASFFSAYSSHAGMTPEEMANLYQLRVTADVVGVNAAAVPVEPSKTLDDRLDAFIDERNRLRKEAGFTRGSQETPLTTALGAVSKAAFTEDEVLAAVDWAMNNGRPDIAQAGAERAERAAKSAAEQKPGVSPESPKYQLIVEDLAEIARAKAEFAAKLRQIAGPAANTLNQFLGELRAEPTGKIDPITKKPQFNVYDENGDLVNLTRVSASADEAVANTRAMLTKRAEQQSASAAPAVRLDEPTKEQRSNWKIYRGEVEQGADDDEFLYHITTYDNARNILRTGLVPDTGKMFGGAYSGYSSGRVFVTEKSGVNFWKERVQQQLEHQADKVPAVAVVRIPKNKIKADLKKDEVGTKDARADAFFSEGQTLYQTPVSLPETLDIDGVQRPTRNSNGQPIAQTEQGIRNFWAWFGDSKVVDERGRPLVVYHGTGRQYGNRGELISGDFDTFDPGLSGKASKTGAPDGTFFFTNDPEVASSYTVSWRGDFSEKYRDNANVMPVYLRVSKPEKVNAKGENWRDVLYKKEFRDVNEIAGIVKDSGKKDGLIVAKVKDHGVGKTSEKPANSYVVFNPEQIKSAVGNSGEFDPQNPNILYQGGEQQSDRLAAIHNLSADNLAFADKMSGIAVPSIGVVRDQTGGVDGFGEITMIGTKDMADPKQEPVFSADAYTVRFPKPEYAKAKRKDADDLVKIIKPFATEFEDRRVTEETFDNMVNTPDAGRVVEQWLRSPAVIAMFLRERGIDAKPVTRPIAMRTPLTPEQVEQMKPLVAALNQDMGANALMASPEWQAVENQFREFVIKNYSDDGRDVEFAERMAQFGYGVLQKLETDIKNVGKDEVDSWQTDTELTEKVEPYAQEFKQWIENKVLPLFGAPTLKIGSKKVPYTLDNIVTYMTSQKVKGEEKTMTFGAGQARAAASIKFNDLEQMRAIAKDEIVDPADYKASKERTEKLLDEYRSKVAEYTEIMNYRGKPDIWEAMDASMRAIAKFSTSKKRDAAALRKALKAEDFKAADIPDDVIDLGIKAANALLRAPVPYFEAKPQRAVNLSEFAGAVIPSDASEQTRQILEKNGIPFVEYSRDDEKGRANAVRDFRAQLSKSRNDVLFQDEQNNQRPLAEISFANDITSTPTVITLLKGANLSSFIHESGHFFLEVLTDISSKPNAPKVLVDDFNTVMETFGIGGKTPAPLTENYKGYTLRFDHENLAVIAEKDGVVVGTFGMEILPNGQTSLSDVVVKDGHRRKGLATAMQDLARKHVNQLTYKKTLFTEDGQAFAAASVLADTMDPYYGGKGADPIDVPPAAQKSALEIWRSMTLEQKRPYHEQFARLFETYAWEGKSPSMALNKVFQRFRAWMLDAYKKLLDAFNTKDLGQALDVKLSDEVRAVFDRMLATQEQIYEANLARGYLPAFETKAEAEAAGVDWEQYQADLEQANQDAITDLESRSLRDMRWFRNAHNKEVRRLRRESAALRRESRIDARAEVLSHPIYQVMQFLSAPVDVMKAPKAKSDPNKVDPANDSLLVAVAKLGGLQRDMAVDQFGLDPADFKKTPVFGKPVLRRNGGLTPDGMAEALAQLGYMPAKFGGSWDMNDLGDYLHDEGRGIPHYSETFDYRNLEEQNAGLPDLEANPFVGGRIDRESMVREYGGSTEDFPWENLSKMISNDGIHPDVIADRFGFQSGDEMVRFLLEAKPLLSAIEDTTDRIMFERHGDLTSKEALDKAADEAIHNRMRAKVLATEANALAKTLGARGITAKVARVFAERILAGMKILDIKPSHFAAEESKAAARFDKARKKGNVNDQALEKRNQLVNNIATRLAYDAEEEVAKAVRHFKQLQKPGSQKSMRGEYLEQLNALLERFELRTGGNSRKAINKANTLPKFADWLQAKAEELGAPTPDMVAFVLDGGVKKPYRDMTLEEFRGLVDAVKQLEHLARREQKQYMAVRGMEFEQEKNAILDRLRQFHPEAFDADGNPKGQAPDFVPSLKQKLGKHANALLGEFLGNETIVNILEGGELGLLHESLFKRISDRSNWRTTRMEGIFKKLEPLFDQYSIAEKRAFSMKDIGGAIGIPITREKALGVALLVGNAEGRDRVRNYGWTDEQIIKIIDLLDERDKRLAEAVWDLFDNDLWPDLKSLNERTAGKAPPKVEATPYTNRLGTWKGGYMRLKYDSDLDERAYKFDAEQSLTDMRNGMGMSSKTPQGTSKERKQGVLMRPRLDFNVFVETVTETVHDIAYREAVSDVIRLLNDKEIQAAIKQAGGIEVFRAMRRRVAEVAARPRDPFGFIEKFVSIARRNTIVTLMSGVGTAFQNLTGLIPAAGRVHPWLLAREVLRFYSTDMKKSYDFAVSQSEYMRHRFTSYEQGLVNMANKLTVKGSLMPDTATFLALMGWIDRGVSVPVWNAAFAEGMEKHANDRALAEEYADHVVRQTQGSGRIVDKPGIMSGHPLKTIFTMFHSYFNGQLQQLVRAGLISAKEAKTNPRAAAGRVALAFVVFWILPALVTEMFRRTPDDEDDEEKAMRYAKGLLLYPAAMFPLVRDVAPWAWDKYVADSGWARSFRMSPVESAVEGVAKGVESTVDIAKGEGDQRDVKNLLMGVGFTFGIPGKLISDLVTGTYDFATGEAGPEAILVGPQPKK